MESFYLKISQKLSRNWSIIKLLAQLTNRDEKFLKNLRQLQSLELKSCEVKTIDAYSLNDFRKLMMLATYMNHKYYCRFGGVAIRLQQDLKFGWNHF